MLTDGRATWTIGLACLAAAAALGCALFTSPARAQVPAAAPSTKQSPSLNAPQDLIAQGSGDFFWVARVATDKADTSTVVYARPSGQAWRRWQGVGQRVISVAARGSQLAMLFENGEWVLTSEEGASTGQSVVPPGSRLLSFAGAGQNLWAVARVPGGASRARPEPLTPDNRLGGDGTAVGRLAPTGAPATTRATTIASPATAAVTSPASAPWTLPTRAVATRQGTDVLPESLALLALGNKGWIGEADIPADVAGVADAVSLGFVEGTAYLAARSADAPATLNIFRLGVEKRWARIAAAPIPADARGFQLLSDTPAPMVRVIASRAGDPDTLLLVGPNGAVRAVPFVGTQGMPPARRAAAFGAGKVRAVWASPEKPETFFEQAYDAATGAPAGKSVPVTWPRSSGPRFNWLQVAVVVAMVFAIAASFRRREEMRKFDLAASGIRLAPLPRRLLAGLIDAVPILAFPVIQASRLADVADPAARFTLGSGPDLWSDLLLVACLLAYIGHTAASEMLMGRTLGKALLGLRVVGFDGKPAPWRAVLMRNVLRVIDAGLMFVPLILIPFSPLYQRAADAAAGTLVVTDKREEEPEQPKDEDAPG